MGELRLDNVSAGYNKKAVVEKVSATAGAGELLVLLGGNGTGKSTLIRTAAGLLPVISGEIRLGGKRLTEYSASERSRVMSVLLSQDRSTGEASCRDVVSLGRYPYTGRFGVLGKEDERIVEEAMACVGVSALADRDYRRISDGQRQRVRLAACLAQEPKILLLDEPTSFLDIGYQAEFLAILKRQAREKGIAVMLSLHEIELAVTVADRLLCLRGGATYALGTPEEIIAGEKLRGLYDLDELEKRIGDLPELAAYVGRLGRRHER